MTRALVLLLVLCGVLFAWDRALLARGGRQNAADPQVELLVERSVWESRTVAALTLESVASGHSVLFARKHGRWVCREAFGASADESELLALIQSLFQARGVVRTADPARASAYGFDDTLRVRLHGPKIMEREDRDVIVGVDLGGGTERTAYVRLEGTHRILEVDRDPRVHLSTRAGTSLPPLIDTRLLAGSTPEGFVGFERFAFTFADGRKFSVESVKGPDPDVMPDFFVVQGARRDPCSSWRIGGYTGLWLRERFDGLANSTRAEELGVDPPFVSIELTPHGKEPIRFDVSEPVPGRTAYVWNRATNTLSSIARELHEKMIATPEMFLDETRPNPWERWLSR